MIKTNYKHFYINEIPVVEIIPEGKENEPLPLAVFYHGWTNNKDYTIADGIALAQEGFRAILPDAIYHGERALPGFEKEMDNRIIANVMVQSVSEFTQLINHYKDRKLILNDFVAVAGQSMGGMTTCMLLASYPEINAACCLMGSPNLTSMVKKRIDDSKLIESIKAFDLNLNPKKINCRPVLFWHAQPDLWVPYEHVNEFINNNKKRVEFDYVYYCEDVEGEHFVPYSEVYRMSRFLWNSYKYRDNPCDIWPQTQRELNKKYKIN